MYEVLATLKSEMELCGQGPSRNRTATWGPFTRAKAEQTAIALASRQDVLGARVQEVGGGAKAAAVNTPPAPEPPAEQPAEERITESPHHYDDSPFDDIGE